ncbi:hypothetical protein BDV28DRAFT_149428 [Aspergillus coremiiformis]|uniref:Uncharacterized protein n=1 Tax=Aspergillus coremiiformis TaxID=138285 RepID=A0A5N6Z4G7_9EURO|nr:hypothetical protein BDV28DRAFT_149428 [Aspergillus coremiiformis]
MTPNAYIKTWIGVPAPQCHCVSVDVPRSSGWGNVSIIILSNFEVQGADACTVISQNGGVDGSFAGTILMTVSNTTFTNFRGDFRKEKEVTSTVSCSRDIDFDSVVLYPVTIIQFLTKVDVIQQSRIFQSAENIIVKNNILTG